MNEATLIINSTSRFESEELTDKGNSVGYNIIDFWRWGMSNLLNNTDRGALAEFIVATAIGLGNRPIDGWQEFDLTADGGRIKIEVKSASYIQAWKQSSFSTIRFSIKKTRRLCPDTNTYSGEPQRHSDLYVFCLLKHKDKETINPLELDQWEFYVVKTIVLDENYKGQASISLRGLQKLTEAIPYNKLKSEILKFNN
ncbi:MAG: hypothetical protein LBP72_11040 [Dysgonamonadaceae bacterium]|jgi:hypothetical protein|nr:hypothetical protein [Dysgonamonadaceae bacterium]